MTKKCEPNSQQIVTKCLKLLTKIDSVALFCIIRFLISVVRSHSRPNLNFMLYTRANHTYIDGAAKISLFSATLSFTS